MNRNNAGKKPFPWTCSRCREQTLFPAIVNHSVNLTYEGRVYHVKVARLKTPKCTNCGQVAPDSEANQRIHLAFLRLAKLLTPRQIRGWRERRGFSQAEIAAELGIPEIVVNHWEAGYQFQTRAQDDMLRDLLTARKLKLSKSAEPALIVAWGQQKSPDGVARPVYARFYLHPSVEFGDIDEALAYLEAGNIDPATGQPTPVNGVCLQGQARVSYSGSGKVVAAKIRKAARYPKSLRRRPRRRKVTVTGT